MRGLIAYMTHGCAHQHVAWPLRDPITDLSWQRCTDCGRKRLYLFEGREFRVGPWVSDRVSQPAPCPTTVATR